LALIPADRATQTVQEMVECLSHDMGIDEIAKHRFRFVHNDCLGKLTEFKFAFTIQGWK
jgi:hypothetical protein